MVMFQEPVVEQQSKEAEVDKNLLKIFIFGFVAVAVSFFAVFFFTEFLSAINLQNFILWLFFSVFFFALVILQTFFIKSLWKLLALCALEVLAPLLFFWQQLFPAPHVILLIGAFGFFLFLFEAVREGWLFISETLTIRFSFVSRGILGKVVTGFLIFLSAVTYTWYFDLARFNPSDGYKLMSNSIFSVEPFLKVWYPGAELNQSVDGFSKKIAEAELRKLPQKMPSENGETKEVDFSLLTKQQQQRVIEDAGENLRLSFEKTLATSLPKDKLVKDVLFTLVQQKINNFSEKTKNYFGLIVILIFFSTGKGFFGVFSWLIRFGAFLLYKILLVLGFAYVSVETRSREFILLG